MTRTELADAMLKGFERPGVVEDGGYYLTPDGQGGCFVCALGAAMVGKYNGDFYEAESALLREYKAAMEANRPGSISSLVASILDIPYHLAVEISARHVGGASIDEITAWLKEGE